MKLPASLRLKLMLTVAAMAVMAAASSVLDYRQQGHLSLSVLFLGLIKIGVSISVGYVGVMRSVFLHRLWGWGCLATVVVTLVPFKNQRPLGDIVAALGGWGCFVSMEVSILVIVWFLVFDRQVAAFRRQLPEPQDFVSD